MKKQLFTALLLLLFPCMLLGQMKTITTPVAFPDLRGNAVTNGTLQLKLLQEANIRSGGGQVAPKLAIIALNSSRQIPSETTIWTSDQLTPTDIAYQIALYDQFGMMMFSPQQWVISGTNPIELSQMMPVSMSVSYPFVAQLTPPNTFTGHFTTANLNTIQDVNAATQTALASAISTACNGTVPGQVLVPPYSIQLSSTLAIPSNCSIHWNRTTLTNGGFSGDMVQINGASNVSFLGKLIINGSGMGTSSAGYLLDVLNTNNFSFDDIEGSNSQWGAFNLLGNTNVRGNRLYGSNISQKVGANSAAFFIGENGSTLTSGIQIEQVNVMMANIASGGGDCAFVGSGASHIQLHQVIGSNCSDEGFEVNGLLASTTDVAVDSVDMMNPQIIGTAVLVRSANRVHIGKVNCTSTSVAWSICVDIATFSPSDPVFSDVTVDQVNSKGSNQSRVNGSGAVRFSFGNTSGTISNIIVSDVNSDSDYNGVYCAGTAGATLSNFLVGHVNVLNATNNPINLSTGIGCAANVALGTWSITGTGAGSNFPNRTMVTTSDTQTLTNKTLTAPMISGLTNGTGLQAFNTTTTCTTAATAGSTCTTAAITLPVAYSDTKYRLSCTGLSPTNVPSLETVTKSNTTFTITLAAITAAPATFTSFDCIVGHN